MKCKHKPPYLIKMGGLICPVCRVIVYTPNTIIYKKYLKDAKAKNESEC